ncbi:Hypothetical protein CINCED_3A022860 [Cinara cedri]|nr:Hypothetical protein CINCED_3A022860 [Cinara cedri]
MMTSSYSAAAAGGRQTAAATAMPTAPSGCVPNTPDVINSIMSMINPFDHHYRSPASEDSTSSSVCSPVSPPRMQSICSSVLIKEDLKLVIKKRLQKSRTGTPTTPTRPTLTPTADCAAAAAGNSSRGFAATVAAATASAGSAASSPGGGQARKRPTDEESHGDEDDYDYEDVSSHGEGLTAEDEERRRRRRERNKLAATKCRQKKREKTTNLMQESNVLEKKNSDMKTQIQELETQRNDLMKMLTEHDCSQRLPYQHQHQQQPQQHHQQNHHLHHQQHQHHRQQQQQQLHQEQYAAAETYGSGGTDPYHGQHHHVAAEPPILKDTMFNGGGYGAVASTVAVAASPSTAAYHRPAATTAAYHRPPATTTAAATVAAVHYQTAAGVAVNGIGFAGVGGGGGGGGVAGGGIYASCLQDDVYGYNKDLMSGGAGGPPDLSHQSLRQKLTSIRRVLKDTLNYKDMNYKLRYFDSFTLFKQSLCEENGGHCTRINGKYIDFEEIMGCANYKRVMTKKKSTGENLESAPGKITFRDWKVQIYKSADFAGGTRKDWRYQIMLEMRQSEASIATIEIAKYALKKISSDKYVSSQRNYNKDYILSRIKSYM